MVYKKQAAVMKFSFLQKMMMGPAAKPYIQMHVVLILLFRY